MRVTVCPFRNCPEQTEPLGPHAIVVRFRLWRSAEIVPSVGFVTVKVRSVENSAVVEYVWFKTVNVQVVEDDPSQGPFFQPRKTFPEAGAALRVSDVPKAKLNVHTVPQDIPEGVEVTVPVPPVFVTDTANFSATKLCVTVFVAPMETTHVSFAIVVFTTEAQFVQVPRA